MRSTIIPILPPEDRLPQPIAEEIVEGNIYYSRPLFLCYLSSIKKHKVVTTRAHHEFVSIGIEVVELLMRVYPLPACVCCVCVCVCGCMGGRRTTKPAGKEHAAETLISFHTMSIFALGHYAMPVALYCSLL